MRDEFGKFAKILCCCCKEEEIGAILLKKIENEDENGFLVNEPYYFNIIRSWAHLSNIETVKNWISRNMNEDAEFMTKIGRGLVSYTVGSSPKKYTMRDRPEMNIYQLDQIIHAGKKHLKNSNLSIDQRNMIGELVRGSEQLKVGKSAEDTGWGSEVPGIPEDEMPDDSASQD